jgi:HEPN domain-containing protein
MNRWKDWYEQGKRDYERALIDVQYGYYEWACFTLQQSAEKVIKALGLARGLTLWGHSLTEMLKLIGQETGIEVPAAILDRARLLDLYYIPPGIRAVSRRASLPITSPRRRRGRHWMRRIRSSGSSPNG